MAARKDPRVKVFLDVDSTLASIEGIDELARFAGCFSYVAELTSSVMNGEMDYEDVYNQRLNAVRPNLNMISKLSKLYIDKMTPKADKAIAKLAKLGYDPTIVSSGPRQAILPFAASLGVPISKVHAVDLSFSEEGEFEKFDETSLLIRADGKARLCKKLLPRGATGIMVGDGHNDAQVKKAKLLFVQFAGVQDRSQVAKQADARIDKLQELPQAIAKLLG